MSWENLGKCGRVTGGFQRMPDGPAEARRLYCVST